MAKNCSAPSAISFRVNEISPITMITEEPAAVVVQPTEIAAAAPRAKKRKAKVAPAPAAPPVQTPIVAVLDLLKRQDSLAAAFLLREILAPPVSKRRWANGRK